MRFIIALLLTALVSFAGCLFFPWWTIAVAAFLIAFVVPQSPVYSFLAGFFALFFLWGSQAFYLDLLNNHLLASKVAHIFPLGGSYVAVILATAIIGGIVAGLAALSGSLLRLL